MKTKSKTLVSSTLDILQQRKYAKVVLFATAGFLLLYTFLAGIWHFPWIDFGFTRMSAIAAFDLFYIVITPVMLGILVALLTYNFDQRAKYAVSGGSVLAGAIAAICPACQGITLAAFGSTIASVQLGFLVPYLGILKIASLMIVGLGVYVVALNIHTKTCITCTEVPKITKK